MVQHVQATYTSHAPAWRSERMIALSGAAALFITAATVYTPWLDVVVLVFLGPAIVSGVLAATLNRRWTYIALTITMALPALMVLFVFGEIAWIWNPHQGPWWDVLSITTMLYALIVGVPAAIITAARRSQGWLPGYAVVTAALLVGITLAGSLAAATAPATGVVSDVVPDATVAIDMRDVKFVPATFTVKAGELVELRLTNSDDMFHTFTYTNGGKTFDHPLPAGKSLTVLVRFDAAATVAFWCEPHKADMTGTITVE